MIVYALVLLLLGATYVALVFLGSRVAMVFADTALAAAIVAVVLTFRR
jgi:hypothetical protein